MEVLEVGLKNATYEELVEEIKKLIREKEELQRQVNKACTQLAKAYDTPVQTWIEWVEEK